jgi:hypothetical protein
MKTSLTKIESARLSEQESIIQESGSAVGRALMVIRDERLYRAEHKTFEDYCQTRWGMTRQHVNRQISYVKVVENLEPMGSKPESERQARPLSKLPAEEQAEAWQEAVNTAPEGKVTAKHVEEVVERRTTKDETTQAEPEDPPRVRTATEELNEPEQPERPVSVAMDKAREALAVLREIPPYDVEYTRAMRTVYLQIGEWLERKR